MVKKLLTILSVIFLFTHQLSAQEKSEEQLVKEGSIRYINYPNNKKNALLYDTVNPYGFYNIIQASFATFYEASNVDFGGLNKSNLTKLRNCSSQELSSLPYLESKLGKDVTVPITAADGGDSIHWEADGSGVFVYPGRDTLYFIRKKYDDLVVKEMKVRDPASGKDIFQPVEIMLRNKLCFSDEPLVTATIRMSDFYHFNKSIFIPIEPKGAEILIDSLEIYLANASKRFGITGYVIDNKQFLSNHLIEVELYNQKRFVHDYKNFEPSRLLSDECTIFEISDTTIFRDEFGNDEVYLDSITGETILRYSITKDTCFYVKNGFEQLYEYRIVYYDRFDNTWKNYVCSLIATKRVFANEERTIVFKFDNETDKSLFEQTQFSERDDLNYLKTHYLVYNSPFHRYLGKTTIDSFPQFPWEEKLYNHTFSGIEIKSPY